MGWLDYFPTVPLIVAAVLLGFAPPFSEPHLWRQVQLLVVGQLVRPVDIADFFLHAALPALLGLKLLRLRQSMPLPEK